MRSIAKTWGPYGAAVLALAFAAGCSANGEYAPAESPELVVTEVSQGLADGRVEAAWRALPPSYRDDVTSVIHDAAAKMDAEVWNASFGVIAKTSRLLEDKKGYIFDMPVVAEYLEDREKAELGLDALVGIFGALAESDLADLDKLAALDVDAFLAETGSDMFTRLAPVMAAAPGGAWTEMTSDLRGVESSLLSMEGETARVRIEMAGEEPVEEDWVRVEGYWVPQAIADGWDARMDEMRAGVEQMSGVVEDKQQILMQLSMVEAAVDQLAAAESAEEFQAGAGAIVGMAMGAAMSAAASAQADEPPAAQADVGLF